VERLQVDRFSYVAVFGVDEDDVVGLENVGPDLTVNPLHLIDPSNWLVFAVFDREGTRDFQGCRVHDVHFFSSLRNIKQFRLFILRDAPSLLNLRP